MNKPFDKDKPYWQAIMYHLKIIKISLMHMQIYHSSYGYYNKYFKWNTIIFKKIRPKTSHKTNKKENKKKKEGSCYGIWSNIYHLQY